MAFFKKNEKCSDDNPCNDSSSKFANNEKLLKFFNKLSKNGKGYAYVYLNMNSFKQINDLFGYDTGNNVLKNITDILQNNIDDDEIAIRLISDEFVLLMKFENQEHFSNRISKIIDSLLNVKITNGKIIFSYNCSFCCGIHEISGDESSFDEIANMAYTAYNIAKQQHDVTYLFFNESMQERNELISSLLPLTKEALSKKQIVSYFQPKYKLSSKEIIGAELLARWNSPKFGIIQPSDFITVFERSGLIFELDLYMFEEACKMLKKWIDEESMPVPMSVNISKFNLYEINFVERVMSIINQYKVPACLINIEVNAMALLENQEKAIEIMKIFHDKGLILSVDNFGKKHVVLDVLYKFPIDILNLDHCFIKEAQESQQIKNVLFGVISLSRQLGITVCAKGVENKEQEEILIKMKCEDVQGYLYSNPQPRDEFEKLIF